MVRIAWMMRLKPGCAAEYKLRHDRIWPEMLEAMRADGVRSFSIYRHGLDLFAYMERDSAPPPDARPSDLTWRWWEMMAPLMETNPDFSPVQYPVEEMFHFAHPHTEPGKPSQ